MRHAARRDENHAAIETIFRKMLSDHVTNSSRWGDGAGDLFVSFGGYCCFVEIKRDAKARFTPAQIRFRKTHPHCTYRCENKTQAVTICKLIRANAIKVAV